MPVMTAVSDPRIELCQFLEVILMWHCAGDIPMDRVGTTQFIEDMNFVDFLLSVQSMSHAFGLQPPSRSDIVRTLHSLYEPAITHNI